jgi:Mg-chelatase subunit ChlD
MADKIYKSEREFRQEVEEEQPYNNKKIKVVEDKVGKKIQVHYDRSHDNNCAMKMSDNSYHIQLNGSIPIRAGIDHELSHIKEGSLDSTFWKPYKSMTQRWYMNNIPYEDRTDNTKTRYDTICHEAMNIIEDIRIESIDGAIYIGRKIAYDSMCKGAGIEWNETGFTPDAIHGYVLAKRFFRDDVIPNEHKAEVNRIYQASKETTVRGIHKIFHTWLNGSLGEYIKEQLKQTAQEDREQGDEHNKDVNEKNDSLQKLRDMLSDMRDKVDSVDNMTDEEKEQYNLTRDEKLKAENALDEAVNKRYQNQKDRMREASTGMANQYGSGLETTNNPHRGFEPTTKQIEAMEKRMSSTDSSKEKSTKRKQIEAEKALSKVEREPAPRIATQVEPLSMAGMGTPHIYKDAVSDIRKLFNTLKQKVKLQISDEGEDIDIETMLEAVKKGSNEFYVDNNKVDGTSIIIAVDCSGSMREEHRLETCQNICATMFKAVDNIPNITMKVVCYGGATNTYGSYTKTGIKEIRNERECNKIGCDSQHILTPTTHSLLYCAEALNKMKGKRKLLIYLTDGVPQNAQNTNYMTLAEQAGKTYRTIKANNPHLVIKPIIIGNERHHNKTYKIIFGKDYMNCSIDKVSDFIRKEFKEAVMKSI